MTGNVNSLAAFSARLRGLPRIVALKVAETAAPALSAAARATFNAGADAYGDAWVPNADGKRVTLSKSGALARYVHYVAIGTKLRIALGVPYARYLIGRYPIFPRHGDPLPPSYIAALKTSTDSVIRAEMGGRR